MKPISFKERLRRSVSWLAFGVPKPPEGWQLMNLRYSERWKPTYSAEALAEAEHGVPLYPDGCALK